jgi:hypothetical protein
MGLKISRIKIQIVPTRLGCWSVWVGGFRIIRSTRDPLVEIAQRMLAAGHKRDARIVMTRTPDGPCRMASTIGNAAAAAVLPQQQPFRAPDWVALHSNGGTL